MKNALLLVAAVAVLFSGISLSEGKTRKKKPAAGKEEPAGKTASSGWTDVKCDTPHILKVAYKFDGIYINIRFQNLSNDKMLRVKYHAKWKKNEKGKWIDDASSEGLSLRLRKQEELVKEVRTHSKDVRDVVILVDASEVS